MPELPEVETVRLQLVKYLVGQTVSGVSAVLEKSLHGSPVGVIGRKVVAVRRLGKMLVVDVEGQHCLAIHFKMSGQLIYVSQKKQVKVAGGHPTEDWVGSLPSKHTRVIFTFASGDKMYFNDQRMFGWVKILKDQELENLPFVQKLGPEPWDIDDQEFFQRLSGKKKAVKVALMDQDVVSGVGNIYANDGLWEAKVDPRKKANTLTREEALAIKQGITKVLREGIRFGGATAADAKYINLDGLGGKYQEHFRTYSRDGEPCHRVDRGVIEKITLGGRGTYFCPICQKK